MAQYKINLTVLLNGESTDEVAKRLEQILANLKWEMGEIEVVEDKPLQVPVTPPPVVSAAPVADGETYVTYRVADEKFRVFSKEIGLQGTELKVPKNRDFLQFRIRAFLQQLGYTVEPKTNIRVVAESHIEAAPSSPVQSSVTEQAQPEFSYSKRV